MKKWIAIIVLIIAGVLFFGSDSQAGWNRFGAWDVINKLLGTAHTWTGTQTFTAPIITTGTAPTLSACGTTPAISGSATSGKITIGTGATTSCTATFATAYAAAPACVIAGDNTAITYAATTSTTVLTITSSGDMASDVISYICLGIS